MKRNASGLDRATRLDLTPEGAARLQRPEAPDWVRNIGLQLERWFDGNETIALQTSGATGEPKTISHTKRAMRASARATISALGMNSPTHALLSLPVGFVGGFMMLVRAIEGGWTLFAIQPSACPGWSDEERWDFVSLTPHQAAGLDPALRPTIGTLLLGGAPVPQTLCDEYPPTVRLIESFGMTETIGHFALRFRKPGAEKPGAFKCLPGITVSTNEWACLVVHAPDLDAPDLETRDLATVEGDCAFHWQGRADDLINSGGILVSPEAIEAVLTPLNLPPFKVYGRSHTGLGQEVVLRISSTETPLDSALTRQLVLAQCSERLPLHHGVRTVEWGRLNLSASGKILNPNLMPLPTLVFATHNVHKVAEVQALLAGRYTVKSLTDIGCDEKIIEDAPTLEGNARIKAAYVKKHYGFDCFADDTGLEVEVLDGAPGVRSARFAGPQCESADNMDKLLRALAGQPRPWTAQFRTAICLLRGEEVLDFEGLCKGEIVSNPEGEDGFGYDPIFLPHGSVRTFAQMRAEEKNAISHRGLAIRSMLAKL